MLLLGGTLTMHDTDEEEEVVAEGRELPVQAEDEDVFARARS